ncbi:MAG: EAL domain-containing protein [Pseudomonadota bacterium]
MTEVIRFPGKRVSNRPLAPADIAQAIAQDRLVMHYQPQYDLNSGRCISAEALVRIQGEDGKLIYPDRFIAQAETSAVSAIFGRVVIKKVLADLARCRGVALPRIAINLSAHQLAADTSLPAFFAEALQRFGLHHRDLEFELTERQRLTPSGRRVLQVLADRGARIVLDDVCTGHATIKQLHSLPISAFKLDRAAVRKMTGDERVRELLEMLFGIAGRLDLDVVAEGIENPEQAQLLLNVGCRYGQGFDFARPMPIEQLQQWIRSAAPQREANAASRAEQSLVSA